MYGIRQDGVAVKLPMAIYSTKEGAVEFARKNQFHAVMFEGRYIFAHGNPFTKQLGNLRVLESVPDSARLFIENDTEIRDVPFYIRGLFGINSKNEIYTRLYTHEFTTASGNIFNIYINNDDIMILSSESPSHLKINDVKNDALILAAETHSLGKPVGFIIAPNCVGYFNMKK